MKRVQNINLLVVLLVASIGGQTAHAWNPFKAAYNKAGEGYRSFKLGTNWVGEKIWGFESNCGKHKNIQMNNETMTSEESCKRGTSIAGLKELGITSESAQELMWVLDAIPIHQKALEANHVYLGKLLKVAENPKQLSDPQALKDPEFALIKDEFRAIEEEALLLGKIERGLNDIMQRKSLPPSFSKSSMAKYKEEFENWSNQINAEEQQLQQAKIEILKNHPFLSHKAFEPLIERVRLFGVDAKYEFGTSYFQKMLATALTGNRNLIEERQQKLKEISTNQEQILKIVSQPKLALSADNKESMKKNIDDVLDDPHVLHELVASVDLGNMPGYTGYFIPQCRLENRVLKDMGMEYLRGLAVNSLLTVGGLGAAKIVMAGSSATKAAAAMRAMPTIAVNAVGLGVDAGMLADTAKRCEALHAAAVVKADDMETGGSAAVAYAECKQMLSAQTVMALLGNGFSIGVDGKALLQARAARMATAAKRVSKSATQVVDAAKHGSTHSAAELAENPSAFVKDGFVTTSHSGKPAEVAEMAEGLKGKQVQIAVSDGVKDPTKGKVQILEGEMKGLTEDGTHYVVKDKKTGDVVRVPVKSKKGQLSQVSFKGKSDDLKNFTVEGKIKALEEQLAAAAAAGDPKVQRSKNQKMQKYLKDEIAYRKRVIQEYAEDAKLKTVNGQMARDSVKQLDTEIKAMQKQIDKAESLDFWTNAVDKLKKAVKEDPMVASTVEGVTKTPNSLLKVEALEVPEAKQQQLFDIFYELDQKGKTAGKMGHFRRDVQNFFDKVLKKVDPDLQAYISKTFPGEEAYAYQINRELRRRGMSSDEIFQKFKAIACECRGAGHCKI